MTKLDFHGWAATAQRHALEMFDTTGEIRASLARFELSDGIDEVIVFGPEESWIGARRRADAEAYVVIAGRHAGEVDNLDEAMEILWRNYARREQELRQRPD